MPDNVLSALLQVVLALIASGLAVKLLTIRQDRRKIAGEASTSEANAASTLSGAALQMVEAAQNSGRQADARAAEASKRAEDVQRENTRLWQELNKARWEVHWMQTQEAVLLAALNKAGIHVPTAPRPENGFPDFPPPDPGHPNGFPPIGQAPGPGPQQTPPPVGP